MTTYNLSTLLEDSARRHPDRDAVVLGDVRVDYQTLNGVANKVANLLVSRGIEPGDKVALSCPNLPQFPAVYNANMRFVQSPGVVAITYELIHDTRIIPIDPPAERDPLRSTVRSYMGASRGHWDGTTLVVETANLKTTPRGSTPALKLVERFTRTGTNAMTYQATFTDPATWTAPWTVALDMVSRPAEAGVFEYACHEGNYSMFNLLEVARDEDKANAAKTAGESK
jgi:non-ribosomal peptide synthetase component F